MMATMDGGIASTLGNILATSNPVPHDGMNDGGMASTLDNILATYNPVTLDEMKAVRLMNRMDQKYMTSIARLPELLSRIGSDYRVQRIDGQAWADYRTLYFDTDDLLMYTQHHNRKLTRQKVRVRCYRSSQTTFFEINNKNNKKKTRKIRVSIPAEGFDNPFGYPDAVALLREQTPFQERDLLMQLENFFSRITLVDNGFNERVTIDSGIAFNNRHTGLRNGVPSLVIIEVKHEVGAPPSPIENALRDMHIHPKRVSKYCIGTVLTNPAAKSNRFKEKMRYIDKILSVE